MLFRGKKIQDYSSDDVLSLIENKVPESKILDYKREIKFDERSKTELIYDINAFYNTEGGFIVVGLEESKDELNQNTAIPKLPSEPITIDNYDRLRLKVENFISASTNPQITNLQFSKLIEINGNNVFIIGVPQASGLPSMTIYNNLSRFYKRNSGGKYIVDTYELNEMFTKNMSLQKEISIFINERKQEVLEDTFWPGISDIHGLLMLIKGRIVNKSG